MNTEQVAHNNMLREIEGLSYCGDVQDDKEVDVDDVDDVDDVNDGWINVKDELPLSPKLVWAACPNSYLCGYQTFLFYVDSDGEWRDQFGVLMFRKVSFWRDIVFGVPVYDGVC